jgi:hypothetical protein
MADGMSLMVHATGVSALLLLASASTAALSQEWNFHVIADGHSIGTHTFKVSGDAQNRSIETTATFRAKALLIPIYHYDHHDNESWKDGCLQKIDADTDDNGTTHPVHGYSDTQGFHLGPDTTLPSCVQTFAYWDKTFLQQSHLLNSQTGEFTSINTTRIGVEQIQVVNQWVAAEHFLLKTPRFSIDLWYSPSGEWLALESLTENGHRLRYERQ